MNIVGRNLGFTGMAPSLVVVTIEGAGNFSQTLNFVNVVNDTLLAITLPPGAGAGLFIVVAVSERRSDPTVFRLGYDVTGGTVLCLEATSVPR